MASYARALGPGVKWHANVIWNQSEGDKTMSNNKNAGTVGHERPMDSGVRTCRHGLSRRTDRELQGQAQERRRRGRHRHQGGVLADAFDRTTSGAAFGPPHSFGPPPERQQLTDGQRRVHEVGQGLRPEYVNRLYGMVARNLSRPFRFVCLTDDERGVREEVECAPIPEMRLDPPHGGTAWRKLVLHRADLAGLEGTVLFLDLDLVIVGPIDPLFEHPGEFCIIHNWTHPDRAVGNSSVFRFEVGKQSDVLDRFEGQPTEHWVDLHRNEQRFLSDTLGRDRMTYWPAEWCASFKNHCVPRWPLNFVRDPAIPAGARIVVFHGSPNPDDARAGCWPAPWHKRWYKHARPARWLGAHWRE